MGLLTYTQAVLREDVRRLIEERTAGRVLDADINRWLDQAIMDICFRTRCLRSSTTAQAVSGTQVYTIPTSALGAWSIVRVDFNGTPLREIPWHGMQDYPDVVESLTSLGTPRHYSPWGRQIYLTPIPNASGTITYYFAAMANALSGDNDTLQNIGVPEQWGPAIEDWAAAQGWTVKDDPQRVAMFMSSYERRLAAALDRTMPDKATLPGTGVT